MLEYWIDVPVRQRNRFLVELIPPFIRQYQQKKLIDSWYFFASGQANHPGCENIVIGISPPPKASFSNLEKKLTPLIQSYCRLKIKGAQFVTPLSLTQNYYLKRYGKKQGIKIFSEFIVYNSQFVIRMLEGLKRKSFRVSRNILALMVLYYFMETLGIEADKKSLWLNKWIHFLTSLLDPTGRLYQHLHKEAKLSLKEERRLQQVLKSLRRGDFNSLCPRISSVFDEYREGFSQIGKKLRSIEKNFYLDRRFTIFQSYIHPHFLCMGILNINELTLEFLALCDLDNAT